MRTRDGGRRQEGGRLGKGVKKKRRGRDVPNRSMKTASAEKVHRGQYRRGKRREDRNEEEAKRKRGTERSQI